MKTWAIAFAAWIWASAGAASAQESADALYISGQADFLQAASGGSGGVEWLHTTDRHGVELGALSGSRGDAWWTYGRAGGFVRRRRVTLSTVLDVGGGTQGRVRFDYQKFAGQVALHVASGVLLETEGQLAHMASDVRRILRLGIRWQASPAVTASGSYYLLGRDGSLVPAVSARLDLERGRASLLGGVVLARHDASAALLNEVDGMRFTATEFFVGCGFRPGPYRVQLIANVARPAGDANRFLVSLRIPLGSAPGRTAANHAPRWNQRAHGKE